MANLNLERQALLSAITERINMLNIYEQNLTKLSATELKEELIKVTIGGTGGKIDLERKRIVFIEYIKRAFPGIEILQLKPTNTAAALNSVSATATVRLNGQKMEIFAKVHVEAGTKSISAVGVENEYKNAQLLADAGFPVVKPTAMSQEKDYPLLLYPKMDAPALFDLLEQYNKAGIAGLTDEQLAAYAKLQKTIGEKEVVNLTSGSPDEARKAKGQALLLERFKEGQRISQWYTPETTFSLPGLTEAVTWQELITYKWQINGVDYHITLQDIVDQARQVLTFTGEAAAFLTIAHFDDHPGNVMTTNPMLVFDPAFGGWNPAVLAMVKPLAHTAFLPPAAMYYSPLGLRCTYKKVGNQIQVQTNLTELPMFLTHQELAKQIIDNRIIPVLKKIKEMGGDIDKETQRIKSGLVGCALLTINIALLLDQADGRAIGLLPMAILFAELKGLPMLEYLDEQIKQL